MDNSFQNIIHDKNVSTVAENKQTQHFFVFSCDQMTTKVGWGGGEPRIQLLSTTDGTIPIVKTVKSFSIPYRQSFEVE